MKHFVYTVILFATVSLTVGKANAETTFIHNCTGKMFRVVLTKNPRSGRMVVHAGIGPTEGLIADEMMALPNRRVIIGIINKSSSLIANGFRPGDRLTLVVHPQSGLVDLLVHTRDFANAQPTVEWRDLKCASIKALM